MSLPVFEILDGCLLGSEVTLAVTRRSSQTNSGRVGADRGSLRILWIVISLAATAGHFIALAGVGPYFTPYGGWSRAGMTLFVLGLVLRFWAICHLGRFFTVDVAVAGDHRLVDDGPFRYIRHPSYTGLLLEFAGIGLTLGSITGWLVMIVPIFLVFLYRVKVEEAALVGALGEPYTLYRLRTKKLVPGIY